MPSSDSDTADTNSGASTSSARVHATNGPSPTTVSTTDAMGESAAIEWSLHTKSDAIADDSPFVAGVVSGVVSGAVTSVGSGSIDDSVVSGPGTTSTGRSWCLFESRTRTTPTVTVAT